MSGTPWLMAELVDAELVDEPSDVLSEPELAGDGLQQLERQELVRAEAEAREVDLQVELERKELKRARRIFDEIQAGQRKVLVTDRHGFLVSGHEKADFCRFPDGLDAELAAAMRQIVTPIGDALREAALKPKPTLEVVK